MEERETSKFDHCAEKSRDPRNEGTKSHEGGPEDARPAGGTVMVVVT